MARLIAAIGIVYLAGVLESVMAPALAIGQITPDWFVIALAMTLFVLRLDGWFAVAIGVALAADLNRGGHLGASALGMALGAAVILWLPRRLSTSHWLVQALATGLATVVVAAWTALVTSLVGEASWSVADVLVLPWARGLYTAAFAAIALMIADWFASPDAPRAALAGRA